MARSLPQRIGHPALTAGLRIGQVRLSTAALAGTSVLALAAMLMLVGPPTWITIVLAAVATALLAMDRRLGWLPAGLVALIALPYGRGADVLTLSIGDWPVRPPDAIIAVAVLGSLIQVPAKWRRGIRRQPVLLAGLAAFALLGGVALLIGLLEGHPFRDVFRDVRFWGLYFVAALALLVGVRRTAIMRALLLGGALLAIVILAMVVLPIFEGGLKAQALFYDRGTLRAQYGGSVFLLPAMAICATALLRRFSPSMMVLFVLLLAAVVLSLTRMSIAAAGAVVAVAALVGIWQARKQFFTSSSIKRFLLLVSGCATAAALAVVLSTFQVAPTSSESAAGGGENPMDRLLGRSERSSIEEVMTSPSGRLASYWEAIQIIREAPVLGSGFGTLVPVEFAYSSARAHVVGMQPGVDNTYLTFAVKAGVLGMAAIAFLLFWPLYALFRGASSRIRPWFIAGWLPVLLLTMTQSFASAGYGPFGVALLLVLPSLHWIRPAEIAKDHRRAN